MIQPLRAFRRTYTREDNRSYLFDDLVGLVEAEDLPEIDIKAKQMAQMKDLIKSGGRVKFLRPYTSRDLKTNHDFTI